MKFKKTNRNMQDNLNIKYTYMVIGDYVQHGADLIHCNDWAI